MSSNTTVPEDAPLVAFATSLSDSGTGLVTVLLWQDTSNADDQQQQQEKFPGGIRIAIHSGSNAEWTGPTGDAVFANTDVPTQIFQFVRDCN